ncbi:MAG TPA: porin family protein [Caulobacteraceae bacterium]|nr:porin family protein [Caulobacteraceae bacterium]
MVALIAPIAAAVVVAAPPVAAEAAAADTQSVAAALALAERLLAAGRSGTSKAILISLEGRRTASRSQAREIQFLLGLIDIGDEDYDDAIVRFHRILVDDPTAVRVRLELGRAYFLNREYENAEREFLFARAGRLPPNVLANVDRYLVAIRSLRTFTYSLAFSAASDSNMNAGPGTDTVSLYGVPFQLSRSAKAHSGVGLALDAGLEWAPVVKLPLKWRFGTLLHRAQYWQTTFDDMTLVAYTGPHLTLKRWDFNLLGNVAKRWYGDRGYLNMAATTANATYFITPRLGLGAGLSSNYFSYPQNKLQDGWGKNVSVNFFYTPSPASIVRGSALFGAQDARTPAFASHVQQFGLSYTREFKGGITIGLSPTYTLIAYQAPLAAFNATRIDHQVSVQATLLNRRIDWDGFTPRLIYTYTRNDSSIKLYAFQRNLVEIGMTRAF